MNTKWVVSVAIVVATAFGLFGTPEKAAAQVVSAITSTKPVVTKYVNNGVTMYGIVQTGTVTLGPNDQYQGITILFNDPHGQNQGPAVNVVPPAQGKTVPWTATFNYTMDTGAWTATASEAVMMPGGGGLTYVKAPNQAFGVPAP
jgi:hypothetical protein